MWFLIVFGHAAAVYPEQIRVTAQNGVKPFKLPNGSQSRGRATNLLWGRDCKLTSQERAKSAYFISETPGSIVQNHHLLTVVSLFTTSIECNDIPIFTRTEKYLQEGEQNT